MKKFLLLSVVLVALDQLTKYLLQGKTIELLPYVSLQYAENTGAAFSLLTGQNALLIFISFIALGVVVYYFRRYPLALSFMLAGLLGNLLDRVLFGFVRDFISIGIWPIFNVADTCATIGVLLLLYAFHREEKH